MKEFIEKLIARLEGESYLTTNDDGETDKFSVQVVEWKDIKEIVNQLAEEYKGGWIPCSERLPETDENRKYLVCGKNGGIYIAEFVCKAVNNTGVGPWWSAGGRYAPEPIAWQPLPPKYEPKGE